MSAFSYYPDATTAGDYIMYGDTCDSYTATDTYSMCSDFHMPTISGFWGYNKVFKTIEEATNYICNIDSKQAIEYLKRLLISTCDILQSFFNYRNQFKGLSPMELSKWKRKLYLKKLYEEIV